MRIVREYFGVDRTTVVYDSEITGVGGTGDEFFIVADATKVDGTPIARTTVALSHDEMARILSDYRCHHPIDVPPSPLRLGGPGGKDVLARVRRVLVSVFRCAPWSRHRSDT